MFTHKQVWAAIDVIAERYGFSASGLAKKAGLDPTSFNPSKRHGPDGRPRNIRVVRGLGMGLDEKAVERVKTWLFEPGKKNGTPVAVAMNFEVDFRLF